MFMRYEDEDFLIRVAEIKNEKNVSTILGDYIEYDLLVNGEIKRKSDFDIVSIHKKSDKLSTVLKRNDVLTLVLKDTTIPEVVIITQASDEVIEIFNANTESYAYISQDGKTFTNNIDFKREIEHFFISTIENVNSLYSKSMA